jgi:hypothetical protein
MLHLPRRHPAPPNLKRLIRVKGLEALLFAEITLQSVTFDGEPVFGVMIYLQFQLLRGALFPSRFVIGSGLSPAVWTRLDAMAKNGVRIPSHRRSPDKATSSRSFPLGMTGAVSGA